ncbi:MAG: hypothetical protein GY838_12920 [bacterium]|nr:hypothetical protein [bacterium]
MKCHRCNDYHAHAWHPRGQFIAEPEFDDPGCDDDDTDLERDARWMKYVADHTFHIASYDEKTRGPKPLEKLVCRQCGGDRFQVGRAGWTTAAKCCGCGWEAVVHDG